MSTLRLATWNVNSLRTRLPHVLDWLARHGPDLLCLQETKTPDPEFPAAALAEAGYRSVYAGQKTYNGVAILSRAPVSEVVRALPGADDGQQRLIAASYEGLRVVNVYVPNGSEVGSDKYAYKLDWLGKLRAYLAAELKRHPRLAVVGDFNIAPQARDVYDPVAWEGSVLFSPPEREAFAGLLETGLVDAFRRFEQPEQSYTWWDYRQGAFRRNLGLRIDHILCSRALAQQCRTCGIDREPRGWERPSDHAPVVAEFQGR